MSDKMPIGEWIEVYGDGQWMRILTKCKGNIRMFGETTDGYDVVVNNDLEWRYPPNPIKELREKMMEEWRRHITLDFAYDTENSQVRIGYFLDWLIENGYVGGGE